MYEIPRLSEGTKNPLNVRDFERKEVKLSTFYNKASAIAGQQIHLAFQVCTMHVVWG